MSLKKCEKMKTNLELVEANGPIEISWCSIFNTYRYFDVHKNTSSTYFCLVDRDNNSILGVAHFTDIGSGVFRSPSRGTFSGIEFQKADLEQQIFFITQIENRMMSKGAKKIAIASAPFHHNIVESTYLFNSLTNVGYSIAGQEMNFAVAVDSTSLIEKMAYNNRKRVKKCQRSNFVFEQVFTPIECQQVYELIAENRSSKGYPISMTSQQVQEMLKAFPESVYFFKAVANGQAVASAICIKIDADVLYVFYWGDLPGFEQYSPITFLANGIYEFCQANQFKLMDAGTSTLNGQPNLGLIKFKENLGMTAALKLSYIKALNET